MSATGRGAVRSPRDYYQTPAWCIRALLDELHSERLRGRHVLDPCAGDGRIGRPFEVFGAKVHYLDLEPQGPGVIAGDFLDPEWRPAVRFDLVVANPPFKRAEAFARRALGCSVAVALLLRINFLGSRERVPFWRAHPPQKLVTLTPRPSFTGGGSDSCEYAWMVWGSLYAFKKAAAFTWALRDDIEAEQGTEPGAAA